MTLLSILINLMWITNKAIHFFQQKKALSKQQNYAVLQVNKFSLKI